MEQLSQEKILEYRTAVLNAVAESPLCKDGWCAATNLGTIIKRDAGIDYKAIGYEQKLFLKMVFGRELPMRGVHPKQEYHIVDNESSERESNVDCITIRSSDDTVKTELKEELEAYKRVIPDNEAPTNVNLFSFGYVDKTSWEKLSKLSEQENVSIKNIAEFLAGSPEYLNGAGYPKFLDGTPVKADTAKYILVRTRLKTKDGEPIVGWFNKNTRDKQKVSFIGIVWDTETEFKSSLTMAHSYRVGRMIFSDKDACKDFFETLKGKTILEPWAYKNRKSEDFKYPILKSYLQFELDRLFYEHEMLNMDGKIIFNPDESMILFNTNLINKYGDDLYIVGKKVIFNGNICISELEVAPSKSRLSKCGYNSNIAPNPPQFFKDINEIVFHCSWDIDDDMDKREHIIEERIERFPEKYRDLRPDDLGQKLNNAINFATKIAQRNYKFIVPMYYPTKRRIQLLMPIYLDTTYSNHPDFALVLTPSEDAKLYIPETILGLDEVYQDARLIAKPEESWLNPNMIK